MDKPVTILIKNIAQNGFSKASLHELKRSGVEEGTIYEGTISDTKVVNFLSPNGEQCVAFVDYTCIIIRRKKIQFINPADVFVTEKNPSHEYVVRKVVGEVIHLSHVADMPNDIRDFTLSLEYFAEAYYYVRKMPEAEFEQYK